MQETNDFVDDSELLITPKHYRVVINTFLNDSENKFIVKGNVWITLTPSEDNVKSVALDIKNLEVLEENVFVYLSKIISDQNFHSKSSQEKQNSNDGILNDEDTPLSYNSTDVVNSTTVTDIMEFQELNENNDVIHTKWSTSLVRYLRKSSRRLLSTLYAYI